MNKWTREQTIVALNVYCKIPFQKASNNNPVLIRTAKLLGRSVNSVKMKVGNFGNLDPTLKAQNISGLSHISKLDKEIWDDYYNHWDKLAYDSEKIIANLSETSIEISSGIDIDNLPVGIERETIIRQRINQYFFRNVVLTSYNFRCAITGLACVDLLEACHIANWANDTANRTNPTNGICLNSLFHKAYDKNYLGVSPDFIIKFSDRIFEGLAIENSSLRDFISSYNGKKLILPNRFLPDRDLLDQRYNEFLQQ